MKNLYLFPRKYIAVALPVAVLCITYFTLITLEAIECPFVFTTKVPMFSLVHDKLFEPNHTYFGWESRNIEKELLGITLIVSALVIAFTKEQVEDEFIQSLRHQALQWSIVVSYIAVIIGVLIFYNLDYVTFSSWALLFPLASFILRFRYLLYVHSVRG